MQQNLLFFYKGIYGELHAGLPFLVKIIEKKKSIKPYFLYSEENHFEKIPENFKVIIEKYFEIIKINSFKFLILLNKIYNSEIFIFTDDLGHNNYTRIITLYFSKARICFFHHAYALLNGDALTEENLKNLNFKKKFDGYHYDPIVIAFNDFEVSYRLKMGFKPQNILISGNLGYKSSWLNKLNFEKNIPNEMLMQISNYDKVVFIPVRGVSKHYLSYENSEYLFTSVKTLIKKNPNYIFLIKPHPRQDDIEKFIDLKNSYENALIINFDTFSAAKISDLVISYWSSSILDAIAVNTPTIEFFRHDRKHHQLISTEDGLISLYSYLEFCPYYTNVEDVLKILSNPSSWNAIGANQQYEFNEFFLKEYPDFINSLFKRLDISKSRPYRKYIKLKGTMDFSKDLLKYFAKKHFLELLRTIKKTIT